MLAVVLVAFADLKIKRISDLLAERLALFPPFKTRLNNEKRNRAKIVLPGLTSGFQIHDIHL